jgi:YgiT-type zinc finger domain-containing protein
MRKTKEPETCEICGRESLRIRKISRVYGKGKHQFVIENIPLMSCPHCGESYFTAETLHEIERLKLHHKNLAVERQMEVIAFV